MEGYRNYYYYCWEIIIFGVKCGCDYHSQVVIIIHRCAGAESRSSRWIWKPRSWRGFDEKRIRGWRRKRTEDKGKDGHVIIIHRLYYYYYEVSQWLG